MAKVTIEYAEYAELLEIKKSFDKRLEEELLPYKKTTLNQERIIYGYNDIKTVQ